MKKSILIKLFTTVLFASIALSVFTACDIGLDSLINGLVPSHSHSFTTEYAYDEENH
jgi:hypothetical protein